MSDLKFSCPHCAQHITCDEAWAGHAIQCPGCQQQITVPAAALGLRVSSTPAAPPPVAPAPAFTPTAPTQPAIREKWCGTAIASLILAFFGPPGWIASIFCGHSAKETLRTNPRLRGDVLATLGLTFSYGFSLLAVVAICVSFYARHVAKERQAERQKEMAAQNEKLRQWLSSPPGTPGRSSSGAGASGGGTPAAPMLYTEPKLELPTNSVSGTIGGQQFHYEHAIARQSQFVLREGKNWQADRQITITTFVSPADLAGKTLLVTPEMRMTKLQVTAEWVDAAGQVQRNWKASGYSLRLKCGPIENGRMAGAIDLRLPGSPATAIKGDFLAAIK